MSEPHLRASDADRAAVAEVLGTHLSDGRLTVAEYDERLAHAYNARTYGELAQLTTDLPATTAVASATSQASDAATTATRSGAPPASACGPVGWGHGWGGASGGRALPAVWGSWLTTALITVVIWAATSLASGMWLYPWPIWVIGPWGAVLIAHTVTGSRGGDQGRKRNRERHRR